jgi:hypothetical protein
MSLHELFSRSRRDRGRRRRLARRVLGLPGLPGLPGRWPAGSVRATPHGLRRLAAIDRALAVETPPLASMFAMFNELAGGEPVGAERLPPRGWPRLRLAQVALLATLAAIVALSVALSTQLHGVMRTCVPAASVSPIATSTTSSSMSSPPLSTVTLPAPAVPPSAPPPTGRAGLASTRSAAFAPLRDLGCQAYAATNR